MMNPAYTLTNDSLTILLNGKPYSLVRGSPNFDRARQAILEERWEDLTPLLSSGLTIEHWLGGSFKVEEGFITYAGERIDSALNTRMLSMAASGANPSCWLNFWERLQRNPSYRSVTQLYSFLSHEGIPIDEEGYILAYKSVRVDYRDHFSGTFDNSPGRTCEMPRNRISDDPNVPCHEGLHCGALPYALSFGSDDRRIVIVRVDPADVVCVPYDHSAHKMRVSKYFVVGNYSGEPLPSTSYSDEAYPEQVRQAEPTPLSKEPTSTSASSAQEDMWVQYDAMTEAELMEQVLPNLRSYAALHLHIVGASKIGGGKSALVRRILEVRRK